MDLTFITDRIAVGGGIWNQQNMMEVVRQGITHIINMQIEFDERALAAPYGVEVCWIPTEDDFQPKPPQLFQRGVEFATAALKQPQARLYIHCAAGVHRGPTMTLAVLCATGWQMEEAQARILKMRYVVDWADVYVQSVRNFLRAYAASET